MTEVRRLLPSVKDVSAARLYPRLLGSSWWSLSPVLQRAHFSSGHLQAEGTFQVRRAPGRLAGRVLDVARVPRASDAAHVRLTVSACGPVERWCRAFDSVPLVTRQSEAPGGLLAERYGPLEFRFWLTVADGTLVFRQESLAVRVGSLRIRLPAWLAVEIAARESPAGGVAHSEARMATAAGDSTWVEVRMTGPTGGLIFAYRGTVTWSSSANQREGAPR